MKNKTPVYKSAIGIAVGDIVSTSYGTGPYKIISISGPFRVTRFVNTMFIREDPVISMTVRHHPEIRSTDNDSYLNCYYRCGDRWFSDQGDELFVQKVTGGEPIALDMFAPSDATLPEPYQYQPGVDYTNDAWHCNNCGDFNAPQQHEKWHVRWSCPTCNGRDIYDIVLRPSMGIPNPVRSR